MKWIYRIENDEGIGPYQGGDPLDFCYDDKHQYSRERPTPWRDPDFRKLWSRLGNNNTYEQWRFGFKTLAQLNKWFNNAEIKGLEEHGFYVVAIPINTVKTYHIGKRQVIFKYK